MRPRKEIAEDFNQMEEAQRGNRAKTLNLEVLLDIRDLLLEKTKPKGKSREDWEKQF